MSSPSVELPDELILEIISRVRTLNELVRCSSLLCKRWRNTWRSIVDGGVLDFDKSSELGQSDDDDEENNIPLQWRKYTMMSKEEHRFATMVDQAVTSLPHRRNLDGLVIRFDLSCMSQHVSRWIEFGLTKRVKELVLTSRCLFTFPGPDSLAKHDLRRLEVLELEGVSKMPLATIDHILCNCPSLRRFALRNCNCYVERGFAAIEVRNCNNLESFSFVRDFEALNRDVTIKLSHAPSLLKFEFSGEARQVQFGNNISRLQEVRFCAQGLGRRALALRLRFSTAQLQKLAPQLDRLGLQLGHNHFPRRFVPDKGLFVFEKLRVLDLFTYTCFVPSSLEDCIVLLMAAPVLVQLSIWFVDSCDPPERVRSVDRPGWETRYLSAPEPASPWKHRSLEVLQLQGLHRGRVRFASARRLELQLAGWIIGNAPSLKQVVVDTSRHHHHHPSSIHCRRPTAAAAVESRLPDQIDRDVSEAKMELEAWLRGRSVSRNVQFTYR